MNSECLILGVVNESREIVLLLTDQRVENGESEVTTKMK
jgi:hypothetical protein